MNIHRSFQVSLGLAANHSGELKLDCMWGTRVQLKYITATYKSNCQCTIVSTLLYFQLRAGWKKQYSRVWDNNFMASAKSALYVNPVGRYEQPRVTKLCAVQQPMQDSVRQNWQKGTSLEN